MLLKAGRSSEGGICVRGNIGRNIGAITADAVAGTVGNMVVDQVAGASGAKGTTSGSGSNSALYGIGGNYDDLVRQTTQQGYNVDAGNQFAGMAGWNLALSQQAFVGGLQDEFGQRANDALAASRAQDQALKQQLGAQFAGTANTSLAGQRAEHAAAAARLNAVGLDFGRGANNWSDDALAIDLGHRRGSWSENDARLVGTESGFVRGLSGDRRSVLEGPAPLSEKLGAGIGAGLTAIGDFVANPFIEVGNQVRDDIAALRGATGGWQSAFAQQVSSGRYGAAALTEFGAVAGTVPLAGAATKGVASMAPAFAEAAYGMSERYLVGGRMYAVPPGEAKFAASNTEFSFKDFNQAQNAAIEWLDARGFKAEQPTLAKFGENAGTPIGMKSADGRVGFRVEYDARSGAHINVFAGKEKGPHFTFEGNQSVVDQIVKQFWK